MSRTYRIRKDAGTGLLSGGTSSRVLTVFLIAAAMAWGGSTRAGAQTPTCVPTICADELRACDSDGLKLRDMCAAAIGHLAKCLIRPLSDAAAAGLT